MSILKGKGILRSMQENAKKSKDEKNKTLVNNFRIREQQKQLFSENLQLVKKLKKAKPAIGTQIEWK